MCERFPIANLIDEIVDADNLRDSVDFIIDHLECRAQRERFRPSKMADSTPEIEARWQRYYEWRERVACVLDKEISAGTFRISRDDVKEITVMNGPKVRVCQAPTIIKRIGIHAIMVVVERHTREALIKNSAASIKGRGMHWLHHIVEEDIRNAPELTRYYFQSDIRHYYDNIPQDGMKRVIREYISDGVLLPILDSFIELLPTGLSKGLRSSQCFANLYLTPVHRRMLRECQRYRLTGEGTAGEVRYLYYNYCDDTDFFAPTKAEAWRLGNIYRAEVAKLGLEVKANYAVRPLTEGLDFLGYVHYPTHSLLRKRIKVTAARKLARVKSRRRRQEVVGSLKGMAVHGDCKNLYQRLTHHHIYMKKFSEMGISYTPADGKKRFPGKVMRLSALQNKELEIHDYESGMNTSHGEDRYLVSFRDVRTGDWGKFFTSSEEMKNILDQISDIEDGFPFACSIESEVFDGNKVKYKFV
jgi:hypothetical protein